MAWRETDHEREIENLLGCNHEKEQGITPQTGALAISVQHFEWEERNFRGEERRIDLKRSPTQSRVQDELGKERRKDAH